MLKLFLVLMLLALLLAAGVLFVPRKPAQETLLDFPPGSSSMAIAERLERAHVIHSRWGFLLMRAVKGGTLKAGEYRFADPATVGEVYERIRRGDVYTRALTIPEGSNLFDVAARIEAGGFMSRGQFLDAARRDTALIRDLDPQAQSLEGYLFPDTYQFERRISADRALDAMVKRFRAAASSIGLTGNTHRVVVMASLVEKETPIEGERPLVASVFVNRLDRGMPLMTDPSVIYGLLLEGRYRGTIYQSDLAGDTAYNTYRRAGLPPGPICSPGIPSLRAALHPAKSEYLYFVAESADPSGHSRFATSLEEHQRNVESYRRTLGARP